MNRLLVYIKIMIIKFVGRSVFTKPSGLSDNAYFSNDIATI